MSSWSLGDTYYLYYLFKYTTTFFIAFDTHRSEKKNKKKRKEKSTRTTEATMTMAAMTMTTTTTTTKSPKKIIMETEKERRAQTHTEICIILNNYQISPMVLLNWGINLTKRGRIQNEKACLCVCVCVCGKATTTAAAIAIPRPYLNSFIIKSEILYVHIDMHTSTHDHQFTVAFCSKVWMNMKEKEN